jgi:hypothetical protein
MRWSVEVTSLSMERQPVAESVQVDADNWQKALEIARTGRGDDGPMSNLSIEVVEDGCRVIDSSTLVRYSVRLAADDAVGSPLEAGGDASRKDPAAADVAVPSAAPPPHGLPPRPSPSTHPPPRPSHTSQPPLGAPSPGRVDVGPLLVAVAATAPAAPIPPFVAPAAPATPPVPVPPVSSQPTVVSAPAVLTAAPPAPVAAPAPAPAAPAVVRTAPTSDPPASLRADVAANLPSQVIFKREQDRTAALPVTYREYVYLVPPGTSEAATETLLQAQLELVRTSLERFPPGKLVNLAGFDVSFTGRPPVAPIATLAWKDWRGDAVVAFPRRPRPPALADVPASAPPVAASWVAEAVFAEPPSPPADAPLLNLVFAPAPVLTELATSVAPAALAAAMPSAPVAIAPPPVFIRPPTPARAMRPPGSRVTGEELIADLFEAMHELHFLRDALEGGDFCLTLAMANLPSQVGLVHVYDIDRREFVLTSARGANAGALLGRRHAESDSMLAAAMRRRRALVVGDASQADAVDASAVDRYVAVGGAQSVVVAPAMQSGRFLGAIELLNPLDGKPFTESDGNAVAYIAEQFATFVAARGVVTDAERITAKR